jgi:hypothetical protein
MKLSEQIYTRYLYHTFVIFATIKPVFDVESVVFYKNTTQRRDYLIDKLTCV